MPAQKRPAEATTPPPSPPPPLQEEKVDDVLQDSENHDHEETLDASGRCSDAYSCIRIRTSTVSVTSEFDLRSVSIHVFFFYNFSSSYVCFDSQIPTRATTPALKKRTSNSAYLSLSFALLSHI